MSKKYKKHGYAERLKYMHMLKNGISAKSIEQQFGINKQLLSYLWNVDSNAKFPHENN